MGNCSTRVKVKLNECRHFEFTLVDTESEFLPYLSKLLIGTE